MWATTCISIRLLIYGLKTSLFGINPKTINDNVQWTLTKSKLFYVDILFEETELMRVHWQVWSGTLTLSNDVVFYGQFCAYHKVFPPYMSCFFAPALRYTQSTLPFVSFKETWLIYSEKFTVTNRTTNYTLIITPPLWVTQVHLGVVTKPRLFHR